MKLNICKIIDQYGWAYYHIAIEQARYSEHNIFYVRIHDILEKFDNLDIDILYLPCPDINKTIPDILIEKCKKRGIKIIGAYSGEIAKKYSYIDLTLSISPQTYQLTKNLYKGRVPTIFLPESIDTEYFKNDFKFSNFQAGWAGSYKRPLKRTYLLKKLKYPVKIQCDRSFYDGKTLDSMLDFYNSINTLLLVSNSECMPRVVLEAMSCSLPIISTDVGSIRILLDDEWIVPVNPESTIIEEVNYRLNLLNKYPKLRKEVGKRNRQYIEKYLSWKNNQKLWDDVFSALVRDDYKKINSISEKYIDLLPNKKEFEKTIFKNQSIIYNVPEIIQKIKMSGVKFCLLKESCLDCINYKKIQSNNLTIGVKNFSDKQKIINFLVDYYHFYIEHKMLTNGNFHIHILVENISKTKVMILNGEQVDVPFPVITYLNEIYGTKWKILT